jgi:PAS domain S-box-containing protein
MGREKAPQTSWQIGLSEEEWAIARSIVRRRLDREPRTNDLEALKRRLEEAEIAATAALMALERRESLYRQVCETAQEGIWAMDAQQMTTYVNPRMAEMLGRSPADIIGQPVTAFMFSDDLPAHEARMRQRTQGESGTYEQRFRRSNGKAIWCTVTATALRAADGAFAGSFALLTDITERKMAEEALRRSEQRLACLLAIAQHPSEDLREFLDFVLTQILDLTRSPLGFIHWYDETKRELTLNTWSKEAMAQCRIPNPSTVYQLEQTGIWGEAVRERRPLLINDFAAPDPRKRGFPPGHVEVKRFLAVPLIKEGKIVAVVAVGNKREPYDDTDIEQLRLALDAAWTIVQRRQAEQALQASEAMFEAVIDAIPEWIHITDEQGRLVFMNRSLLAQLDRMGLPTDFQGKTVRELFPFLGKGAEEGMARARTTGTLVQSEEETLYQGQRYITETRLLPLPTTAGKGRLLTMVRDITREREQQAEILRAKEEWERTFNAVPDLIAILSPDRKIIRMNQAMANRLGINPAAAQGRFCYELMHDPAAPPPTCPHERLLRDGLEHSSDAWESRLRGHFLITASPIRDGQGNLLGSVHVARDVTEIRQAQAALAESEERFRTFIEKAGDAIFIYDERMVFLEANTAACRRLGYTREELLRMGPADLSAPEFAVLLPERIATIKQQGSLIFETEHVSKNGTRIPTEISASLVTFQGRPMIISIARDISERKRAEQALEESREKYRLLFTRMGSGFALHEMLFDNHGRPHDYRFLEVNPAFEEMTGLKAHEIIGRTVREVLPGVEPFWIATYGQVVQTGETLSFEHYTATLDRYYEVSAFRPRPGQFAVMITDVTSRKLIENALEESEEKFRALVENLDDAVGRLDRNGGVLYVSPAIVRLLGQPPEFFLDRTIDTLPAEFQGLVNDWRRAFDHVLATGQSQVAEFRFATPTATRDLECWLFPECDEQGQVRTVLTITRDITSLRKAQAELRESEERFRALAEAADEAIVILSHDGRIIDGNRQLAGLVGAATLTEVLGRSITEFFQEPWKSLVRTNIQNHLEQPYETELVRLDDQKRWVRISPKETRYRGEPARVSAIQDLTPKKQAAERLRESNDRLHALASKLETIREDEKARVSREIHDDLGQLLTGMKVEINRVAEWLNQPLGTIATNRLRAKVQEVGTLAHQALETVRRIARELRPSLIDDLGLIAAIDWQVANFHERSGIECDLKITLEEAAFPKEVSIAIYRILQEALTNVLRHAQARRVGVRLFLEEDRVVFEVEDDGIGMPEAIPTAARSLGIMGMKERALHIGGTLFVESRPGSGTLIRLEIPRGRLQR